MLNDIMLGQYLDRDSVIHKLDPRTKIILVILFVSVLFISKTFFGYLTLGLFVIVSILASKIEFKYILKSLKPLLFIIGFTLIIHLFLTKGGEVIWEWKFLSIEEKGFNLGVFMAARLIFLITFTSLLTLTTSPLELTDGLETLLEPFKRFGVPAHELAMMMTIALRFIPTLLEEAEKILKAQKARGADFESGNLIEKAKNLIPLLVPLFVSAFRRADDLALAMEARCYRGGEGRTRMNELRLSRLDYIIGILATVFLVIIIIFT